MDGVYLDLHGAMFATGTEDAEGEIVKVVRKHFIYPRTDGCGAPPPLPHLWGGNDVGIRSSWKQSTAGMLTCSNCNDAICTSKVRDVVGEDALLSASFDLHGNFSARMAAGLDLTTAYRTAPHIDIAETQLKAVAMLAAALRSRNGNRVRDVGSSGGSSSDRPYLAYVPIPLGISGEMSNTADEPTKKLYSSVLHEADAAEGVMDASILVGYVWVRDVCASIVPL